MQNATNFKGLNNVLEGIEIGTLLAINNSLGFYHNHMFLYRFIIIKIVKYFN